VGGRAGSNVSPVGRPGSVKSRRPTDDTGQNGQIVGGACQTAGFTAFSGSSLSSTCSFSNRHCGLGEDNLQSRLFRMVGTHWVGASRGCDHVLGFCLLKWPIQQRLEAATMTNRPPMGPDGPYGWSRGGGWAPPGGPQGPQGPIGGPQGGPPRPIGSPGLVTSATSAASSLHPSLELAVG